MRDIDEANFLASPCALTAGLCLRLFFLLKFPATSGDTVLYEQIATNWLKHHLYAMTVGGKITPVDLRMRVIRRFSPSSTLSRDARARTRALG